MTEKKQISRKYGIIAVMLTLAFVSIVLLRGSWVLQENTNTDSDNFRIVSLAPSITEMLFALGVGDCIVGVTEHCNYPVQARDIERVGQFGPPNIEKLLSLSPDLVISTNIPDNDVCKLLSQSGIELLEVKIENIESMFDGFRLLGQAAKKPEQAEKLIAEMKAELDIIRQRYNNIAFEQLPKVFIEIWYDPITTAGGKSFIDDVITKAGGINVAHNISQAYPCINPEMVIQWNPDVIISCYMGNNEQNAGQISKRIGWSEISAVKSCRIISDFPNDLILRPGPRLIEGIKALSEILYKTKTEKLTERH